MVASAKPLFLLTVTIMLGLWWPCPSPCDAGVVVLSNGTAAAVEFAIQRADGKTQPYRLKAQDLVPIPVAEKVIVVFDGGGTRRRYLLHANSVHYFVSEDEALDLVKIAFADSPQEDDLPEPPRTRIELDSVYTIPVMLLVDEEEAARRQVWEKRLRERLAAASDIIECHCRVRLEAVAVGTWESDDEIVDFSESLREFEMKVTPAPARLAIGFTSQYEMPKKRRAHLGGTRAALHSHILIREWSQHISTTERLEVLLHELGHFLGATHSEEANSVMRPRLGDGLAHARSFRIGFDPPNTLIMNLLCEELRTRQVRSLSQLRPNTKARLRAAYQALGKAMPQDPAAQHYLTLLNRSPHAPPTVTEPPASLIEATAVVVRAISEAAHQNHSAGPTGTSSPRTADRLTEFYVRRAAAAAAELPPDQATKAFLLGLGIGLDKTTVVRNTPIVRQLCRRIETEQQRRVRVDVLGSPTMRGRTDLTHHFVVSAALTALIGPHGAETAGIDKELRDARGTSGFSFVDLCADVAGVTFAVGVRDAEIPLQRVASSFAVADYLPDGTGLREGIAWKGFLAQYGSAEDEKFHRQQAAIRQLIQALPAYRGPK